MMYVYAMEVLLGVRAKDRHCDTEFVYPFIHRLGVCTMVIAFFSDNTSMITSYEVLCVLKWCKACSEGVYVVVEGSARKQAGVHVNF